MKILYDKVSSRHLHPLSKADVERINDALPSEIVGLIQEIRFTHNGRTAQEGRMVRRGRFYEIRVNFCLTDVGDRLQSRMLSDSRRYVDEIRRCGGKPHPATKLIDWDLEHAKRYACYVLLHEIGHVVHLERYVGGRPVGKAQAKEEKYCDSFAAAWANKLTSSGSHH